ncbi:MAG: hypothetical protein VXW65_10545 [Pseudomonadota bacterium]|nr:hypothetical protein [Pseudomonadota bacterium]
MTIFRNRALFVLSTLAMSLAVTSCGDQTAGLTLVAGQERSHIDGYRSVAKFALPYGIVSDDNDVMFVVDAASHTVRRITPKGTVSTLAGSAYQAGTADGVGSAATFDRPVAIAIDKIRNRLYVADIGSNTIRMVSMNGTVTTFAGQAGQAGHIDGNGGNARFMFSSSEFAPSMSVDQSGNLYVQDFLGLRKITPQGEVSTHFADTDAFTQMNGTFTDDDGYNFPVQANIAYNLDFRSSDSGDTTGFLIDSNDNFITSKNSELIQLSTSGSIISNITIPSGTYSGTNIGIDADNNVLIIPVSMDIIKANLDQQTVQQIKVLPPSPSDEPNSMKTTEASIGVVVDKSGNLLSADMFGAVVRKYTPSTMAEYRIENGLPIDPESDPIEMNAPVLVQSILTGKRPVYGAENSSAFNASFMGARGVTSDNEGGIYITDLNHAIRRLDRSSNLVVTRSGKSFSSGTTDGLKNTALFNSPSDIVFNTQDNRLYILDNNGTSIRRMTVAGATITINLSQPINARYLVKSPNTNNMFIKGDTLMQRVTPSGAVSPIADLSSYSGYSVQMDKGLAIDSQESLYTMSNGRVLKVTAQGNISTLAGSLHDYGDTNGALLDARFQDLSRVVGAHPVTGDVYVSECKHTALGQGLVDCKLRTINQTNGTVYDTGVKTSFHIGPIHFAANGDAYTTYENAVYSINLN